MPAEQNNNNIASRLKKPVHPYLAYGIIAAVTIVIAVVFLTIAIIKTPRPIEQTGQMTTNISTTPNITPTMTPTELDKDSTQVDTQLTQSSDDLNNIDKILNDQMDPSLQNN